MPVELTVAQRIAALKNIFNEFGIPVAQGSVLEQIICAEFGPGKRSGLTKILLDLHSETDAAVLSRCIGYELAKITDDACVMNIADIMQQQLPDVLNIIDIKQQTQKRIQLLEKILLHFELKLAITQPDSILPAQVVGLQRSIAATRQQLQNCISIQSAAEVIESTANIIAWQSLSKFAHILHAVTPALVFADQADITITQRINLCLRAVNVLSVELENLRLARVARILDDLHWLAQVSLPQTADLPTIEQALSNLSLSIGNMSIRTLKGRGAALGLSEKELTQMLYTAQDIVLLSKPDHDLLKNTQQNKQLAAVCGLLAKLGQDIGCEELTELGIVGLCVICLRQTYCEIATGNLNVANFSESFGVILTGVGAITRNKLLTEVGTAITDGLKVYAGIVAIPGCSVIAIPLALCTVLGSTFLKHKSRLETKVVSSDQLIYQMVNQFVRLRAEMHAQFNAIYDLLQTQHAQLLQQLDQICEDLSCLLKVENNGIHLAVRGIEQKIDKLQYNLSREFKELFLEYIRDPLQELDYHQRYRKLPHPQLEQNKLKLSMWLLYKSKQDKANGRNLLQDQDARHLPTYMTEILSKNTNPYELLGLLNSYVNAQFTQNLPEELPQVPSWIMAANAYIKFCSSGDHQNKELEDIVAVGQSIQNFVQDLAHNSGVFDSLWRAVSVEYARVQAIILQQQLLGGMDAMMSLNGVSVQYLRGKCKRNISAASAPANEQLENFTPFDIDINKLWDKYFAKQIPQEFALGEMLNMGTWQVQVAIDKSVNRFIHVRMPYHHGALPDEARDVIFRFDVYYKYKDSCNLIYSAWFAYDLHSAQKRFHEYYQAKFEPELKCTEYMWLDVNGKRMQLEGGNITESNKSVDPAKVAGIYKQWLRQAVPINMPTVLARIRQNPHFHGKCRQLLENAEYLQIHRLSFMATRINIRQDLRRLVLKNRITRASSLLRDQALWRSLEKIDAYSAVDAAYRLILQQRIVVRAKLPQIQQLLIDMQQENNLNVDYSRKIKSMFKSEVLLPVPSDKYRSAAEFVQLQQILASMRLTRGCSSEILRI